MGVLQIYVFLQGLQMCIVRMGQNLGDSMWIFKYFQPNSGTLGIIFATDGWYVS